MLFRSVQFVSGGEINENLTRAKELISTAAGEGAQLIVLPEATAQSFASGRLDVNAQELDGDFATQLKAHAEELGVTVVAGMFRPADSVDKGGKTINRVYNTALITGPGVHLGYNKIHTYDAFNYRESDTVKPGNELVTFELDGVTIGVAICYDVRFPEQFKALARQGAEVIVVPTSWADGPEKRDQWRLLSATRALDSTAYVICAGQARPGGNDKAGEASGPTGIGHSVIVSPTAERLAEAGYEEDIIYADIDPELVAKTRKTLPVLEALS